MPGRDDTTVTAAYERGLRLAQDGSWFEAHEAFELAWRASEPAERDFFQGLVHVVVCAYQHGRGRTIGETRQRAKALRRLAPFAPAHRGLDVAALLASLDRAEPDVRHQLVQRVAQPPVAMEEEQQAEHDEGRP
jgi:predicted metal-dependent hydrolase